jgi:hypothetical protein
MLSELEIAEGAEVVKLGQRFEISALEGLVERAKNVLVRQRGGNELEQMVTNAFEKMMEMFADVFVKAGGAGKSEAQSPGGFCGEQRRGEFMG